MEMIVYVSVLSECVPCACLVPRDVRAGVKPIQLELQMIESYPYVGWNQTHAFCKSSKYL